MNGLKLFVDGRIKSGQDEVRLVNKLAAIFRGLVFR